MNVLKQLIAKTRAASLAYSSMVFGVCSLHSNHHDDHHHRRCRRHAEMFLVHGVGVVVVVIVVSAIAACTADDRCIRL